MFKKIFEYAGPYKKNMYVATVVVLVSVLMEKVFNGNDV